LDDLSIRASLIKAPFIKIEEIQKKADDFRAKYWKRGTFPIDIMHIVEFELKLDFDPRPNLKSKTSLDAILSGDCSSIIIDNDEFLDDRFENRLRFSCAHEIGHLVLHRDIYKKLNFKTEDEWVTLIEHIPDSEYSWIEFQAYVFAGKLLVPNNALLNCLQNQKDKIQKLLPIGQNIDPLLLRQYVSSFICKEFGVSSEVVYKRIEREKIDLFNL
jgi:uncharacterized protein DUF955